MTTSGAVRRRRAAVLLAFLATALSLVLSACGGGGGEEDAEALLDRAFRQSVPSADVEIDAELKVDGLQGFDEPITIRASGPYIDSKATLPKLDMDLEIGGQGAGAVQSGLLSTGRRVFLKFGGTYFEQPADQVARTNRRLARDRGKGGGSLSDLGLNARDWIVDASVEGEEEIGGAATEHVSGKLDVEALVRDLNDLLEQSGDALAGDQAPEPLKAEDIERLSRTVDDPTFDVYVGKEDDVVRRISLRLDLEVPEDDQADVGGVTGASISFSAELSDVGGDQQVRAPRTSQPISVLTSRLGGLSGLAGGLSGSSGGGGATGSEPPADGAQTPSGGAPPDADAFERYGECLERARPDDATAIERCAQLVE
jgi:Txe/YoeB family toxin of Txe-Axe toxin-antitoxin module